MKTPNRMLQLLKMLSGIGKDASDTTPRPLAGVEGRERGRGPLRVSAETRPEPAMGSNKQGPESTVLPHHARMGRDWRLR